MKANDFELEKILEEVRLKNLRKKQTPESTNKENVETNSKIKITDWYNTQKNYDVNKLLKNKHNEETNDNKITSKLGIDCEKKDDIPIEKESEPQTQIYNDKDFKRTFSSKEPNLDKNGSEPYQAAQTETESTTKHDLEIKRESIIDEFIQNGKIGIEYNQNETSYENVIESTNNLEKDEKNEITDIKKKLGSQKRMAFLGLTIEICSFFVSLWLFFVNISPEKLPHFLQTIPTEINSISIKTALLLISIVLSSDIIIDGFLKLIKLKMNAASLLGIMVLSTLAQDVIGMLDPYFIIQKWANMYSMVAIAIIACHQINKCIILSIACKNIEMLDNDEEKFVIKKLNRDLTNKLSYIIRPKNNDYSIYTLAKVKKISGILKKLSQKDYFDNLSIYIIPFILVTVGIASWYITTIEKSSTYSVITAISAILVVASPMASNLSCTIPLFLASKSLKKVNASIWSLKDFDVVKNIGHIVIKSEDIFAKSHIQLLRFELFEKQFVDFSIIGAASILSAAKVEIAWLFINMISDTKMLEPVENLNVEGNVGFSGRLKDKSILLGDRELMINHNVRVPSREFEKTRLQVRDDILPRVLYIAVDDILTAMFVIGYKPVSKIKHALHDIQTNEVSILFMTNDTIMSPNFIAKLYNLDTEKFEIVPDFANKMLKDNNLNSEKSKAKITITDKIRGFAASLNLAQKVQNTAKISSIMQCISIFLGVTLVVYFLFSKNLELLSGINILIYHVLWLCACFLLPFIEGI